MELKELQDKHDLLQKEVEKFTEEVKVLKEANEKLTQDLEAAKKFGEEATAKAAELLQEKKMSQIDAKVKEFIEAKKIIPAQAEKLKVILSQIPGEKKFSVGDKECSLEDVIYGFIGEGPEVGLSTSEKTEKGKTNEPEDMDLRVKKYMAEHSVSYKEAYLALANEPK